MPFTMPDGRVLDGSNFEEGEGHVCLECGQGWGSHSGEVCPNYLPKKTVPKKPKTISTDW